MLLWEFLLHFLCLCIQASFKVVTEQLQEQSPLQQSPLNTLLNTAHPAPSYPSFSNVKARLSIL